LTDKVRLFFQKKTQGFTGEPVLPVSRFMPHTGAPILQVHPIFSVKYVKSMLNDVKKIPLLIVRKKTAKNTHTVYLIQVFCIFIWSAILIFYPYCIENSLFFYPLNRNF
jgi:hypothetical protein